MKKSDEIRYIDPTLDRDLVDSIIHNRPRQDLLNNWRELRQILTRITRATGTSPHISQVPFWGDRFAIGPQDNFVAAISRLDSSLYNLYGMVAALLAASSDNITYADALAESKLRVSRKVLVASTTHLVSDGSGLYFPVGESQRIQPFYLSTWNTNKTGFRLGDAPIFCYRTRTPGPSHEKLDFFYTTSSLDSWSSHNVHVGSDYWQDVAIFPYHHPKHGWIIVRWRAWSSGEGEGGVGTRKLGGSGLGHDFYKNLDEDEREGRSGTPVSFSFPTPDCWVGDHYHQMFGRAELRYASKYWRVVHCSIDASGKPHVEDYPGEEEEYIPWHFENFYRGVQYYFQWALAKTNHGILTPVFTYTNDPRNYYIKLYCCWWAGTWHRSALGRLHIPNLHPVTNMRVTSSITVVPGEADTYLVLFSAYYDDWALNYWKKIVINNYRGTSGNTWHNSDYEEILDENGNVFDHKIDVCSNVPMIDGKKLVVDYGAGPGEPIQGVWVRELELRTI